MRLKRNPWKRYNLQLSIARRIIKSTLVLQQETINSVQ
jgi:hypothetical protein